VNSAPQWAPREHHPTDARSQIIRVKHPSQISAGGNGDQCRLPVSSGADKTPPVLGENWVAGTPHSTHRARSGAELGPSRDDGMADTSMCATASPDYLQHGRGANPLPGERCVDVTIRDFHLPDNY
jgi:hypothetical protein